VVTTRIYEFGGFRLDSRARRLLRDGQSVDVPAKAFDALLALVEHCGRLVEKDELMRWLWPDTIVEEANLTQTIFVLRKALGEAPGVHQYIATIPRRGYQFVAPVLEQPALETPATPRSSVQVRSLAVLPFTSLGPEGGDQYLGLGITDALITRLGNIHQIVVRPTSAVRRYVGAPRDAVTAGRELDVEAVLEGSVQREGDRVRVSVQLVSVKSAAPVWGERFDERFADIFALEDSISARIAGALAENLTGEEQRRLTRRYTEDPGAHEYYLKGRLHWNRRTANDLKKAIAHFERAVAQDAGYALAYSGLADCYTLLGSAGYDAEPAGEAFSQARTAALRALDIDQDLAEAQTSLGLVRFRLDWDWVGAESAFRRAIECNRGYASAPHFLSLLLSALERTDEAIASIGRARELDPLSLTIGTAVGRVHHFARQYDRAIEACRKVLEMEPAFPGAHVDLGLAYLQQSMFDEAIVELRQGLTLSAGRSIALAVLGYAYALAGDRGEAVNVLDQLD
jgi:TolB-like protein/Flp pilus assembly protein TadD